MAVSYVIVTSFLLLLHVTAVRNEPEYMHEGSHHLYTLRELYTTSQYKRENTHHCVYPNFCKMEKVLTTSRFCKNDGKCMFDSIQCRYWCVCANGYEGAKCKSRSETLGHQPRYDVPGRGEGPHDVLTSDYMGDEPDNTQLTIKIYNETAFGVPDYRYYNDLYDADSVEEQNLVSGSGQQQDPRSSMSDEQINATCDTIERSDNDCPHFFSCAHGMCIYQIKNDSEHGEVKSMHCECDAGWKGERCEVCCDKPCQHGSCEVETDGKKCFCEWNYYGDLCDKEEVVQPSRQTGLEKEKLGVSLVVAAGLLALVALVAMPGLLYYMWRQRVPLVLRLIRVFQPWEDSDDKKFDAFVSYRSSSRDESFVVHHLYPKLELEHNFKLCLHFRDFEPGETIANNIIRAIHESRRTIMILSPSYVTSEWARFEYQVAQHEMLKLRHKIIPIILDDISNVTNMDPNLEAILRSVTFIKYPGVEDSAKEDTFWKKVTLSLPKKRESSSGEISSIITTRNHNSTSTAQPTSSSESETEAVTTSVITAV